MRRGRPTVHAEMPPSRKEDLVKGPWDPAGSNGETSSTKEEQMILATTTVEDVDRFLEVFSTKGAVKRKEHGSKGASVFRDPTKRTVCGSCSIGTSRAGKASSRTPRFRRSSRRRVTKTCRRPRRTAAGTTPKGTDRDRRAGDEHGAWRDRRLGQR